MNLTLKIVRISYVILTCLVWSTQVALVWLYYWHSILKHPLPSNSNEYNSMKLYVALPLAFGTLIGIFWIGTDIVVSFHYRKFLFHYWRALILAMSIFIVIYVDFYTTWGGWYFNLTHLYYPEEK